MIFIPPQEPDNRFTYCQDYNSATVVPVNVPALKKQEEQASVDAWQTKDGFIYPGMENALHDNRHLKQPDAARRDELRKVCTFILSQYANGFLSKRR